MKIIYNCWFALCMLLLITSCNDEWKDEQYRQYISFKAPIKDKSYRRPAQRPGCVGD